MSHVVRGGLVQNLSICWPSRQAGFFQARYQTSWQEGLSPPLFHPLPRPRPLPYLCPIPLSSSSPSSIWPLLAHLSSPSPCQFLLPPPPLPCLMWDNFLRIYSLRNLAKPQHNPFPHCPFGAIRNRLTLIEILSQFFSDLPPTITCRSLEA